MTTTISATYGRGYKGKLGTRCWLAQINGSDEKYGMDRDFLDADTVEAVHPKRHRTAIHLYWDLGPGLYEISRNGEREIFAIDEDGTELNFDEAQLNVIQAFIRDGASPKEAVDATR